MAPVMGLSSLSRSSFTGQRIASFSSVAPRALVRTSTVAIQAKKVCQLTGKERNKANVVTFSNKHNRKWQDPNLQHKKIYWAAGQRWVKLRICTKAIKTVEKKGIDAMAKEAGIDLWKLPFEDARPQRKQYLADNKGKVPVAVNPYAIKNPVKIQASTKQPKYPVYEPGGRIVWIRPGMEESIFGSPKEEIEQQQQQQQQDSQPDLKITITS